MKPTLEGGVGGGRVTRVVINPNVKSRDATKKMKNSEGPFLIFTFENKTKIEAMNNKRLIFHPKRLGLVW